LNAKPAEPEENSFSLRGLRFLRFLSFVLAAATSLAAQTAPSLGRISFPTSGSAKAQPAFVRGVLLLYSFEYDDAIEQFRDAERLDPGFAMAYWGEAMCYNQPLWYNENLDKARAVLARLRGQLRGQTRSAGLTPIQAPTASAAKALTAREKAYLDAVQRLYGDGNKATRDRAYADRMAELTRQYPDDDDAATFYALALLATIPSGERNTTVSLKAGGIALAVLEKNPEHPGAAHYALHAFDDGEHAAMGLDAARTYARIAPASSHARHMPSHVFLPLGMWDEAAASDESAFAASVALAKRKGRSAAQYDFHSLSWLHYEYLQQGRFAKARDTMREVERAIAAPGTGTAKAAPYAATPYAATPYAAAPYAAPVVPGFSQTEHQHVESEIGRGFSPTSLKSELASMKARLVVESGDWAQMKGQGSFDNIDELFALGAASVSLGDLGRADAAVEHLGNASKTVPDRDAREVAGIMGAQLDGLVRLARGDRAGGIAAIARAAALEAKRPRPIARPYPIKPAAELYAETLLKTGDAAGAVRQFQAALARTPRRAASLLGLVRAEQKAGRHADAANAAREFLKMWHLADAGRPELAEAKRLSR
jgi:tetratricopeptide (TPR) repeat protein